MNSKMMRCGMASANTEHHLPNRTLRKPPQDKQEAPKQPQSKQRPGGGWARRASKRLDLSHKSATKSKDSKTQRCRFRCKLGTIANGMQTMRLGRGAK